MCRSALPAGAYFPVSTACLPDAGADRLHQPQRLRLRLLAKEAVEQVVRLLSTLQKHISTSIFQPFRRWH